jgi:hypothetical protein
MDNNQDELTQLRQENARLRSELAQTQLQCQHYERRYSQKVGQVLPSDLPSIDPSEVDWARDDLPLAFQLVEELQAKSQPDAQA